MINKEIKVTLKKSMTGRKPSHIETIKGLGLRRIGHSVVLQSTPEVLGMVNLVSYVLKVE